MFSDVSERLLLIFLPSFQYQSHILFNSTCETKGNKQDVVTSPNKISKRPRHLGQAILGGEGQFFTVASMNHVNLPKIIWLSIPPGMVEIDLLIHMTRHSEVE